MSASRAGDGGQLPAFPDRVIPITDTGLLSTLPCRSPGVYRVSAGSYQSLTQDYCTLLGAWCLQGQCWVILVTETGLLNPAGRLVFTGPRVSAGSYQSLTQDYCQRCTAGRLVFTGSVLGHTSHWHRTTVNATLSDAWCLHGQCWVIPVTVNLPCWAPGVCKVSAGSYQSLTQDYCTLLGAWCLQSQCMGHIVTDTRLLYSEVRLVFAESVHGSYQSLTQDYCTLLGAWCLQSQCMGHTSHWHKTTVLWGTPCVCRVSAWVIPVTDTGLLYPAGRLVFAESVLGHTSHWHRTTVPCRTPGVCRVSAGSYQSLTQDYCTLPDAWCLQSQCWVIPVTDTGLLYPAGRLVFAESVHGSYQSLTQDYCTLPDAWYLQSQCWVIPVTDTGLLSTLPCRAPGVYRVSVGSYQSLTQDYCTLRYALCLQSQCMGHTSHWNRTTEPCRAPGVCRISAGSYQSLKQDYCTLLGAWC